MHINATEMHFICLIYFVTLNDKFQWPLKLIAIWNWRTASMMMVHLNFSFFFPRISLTLLPWPWPFDSSDNFYSALYESKYCAIIFAFSLWHLSNFLSRHYRKKQEPVIFLPTTLQNLSKSLLKVKNPFLVVQGRPGLKVKLKSLRQKRCRNRYCRGII